jgi:predicted metal-dependent phosphoesterase TrpH
MVRIDFHTHTHFSHDSLAGLSEIILISRRRGLDYLVISDHNTIAGALAAQALDPDLVIIGEEIMTTRGEILASFVTEEVPPGLSPQETIRRLRDQDAFISVSHPFDSWRDGSWELEDLFEITPLVDALEIFNSRCMAPGGNQRALEFSRKYSLPGTAGSDAHTAFEVGVAALQLPPFTGPQELRIVIREGKVKGRLSPFWVHFFSRYAHFRKKVV